MAGLKFDITGDNGNMLSALHGVQKGVRQTQQVVEQSGQGIEQMFAGIKSAAVSALGAFSAQQFASKVMNVRGQFQQLEVAFETMLGSAEKANSLMGQLVKTAAVTPFDLQGVANGAKQLLAYGIQADDVNETLVRLGDIAAGLSMPLNDLVYLYGTTMVQGRMFTMDLRQFQGRGIPIADELAKQFGVAKEKVGELVTAGKVGSEEMKKAIISMTSEGGKFAGLMEKQSHTITGQISNIEDAVDTMFNEIGKKSEGVINTGLSSVSYLVENWEKIGKVVLVVASAYGTYKAALLAVYAAHKISLIAQTVSAFFSLTKSITTAKDAMLLFNIATKANPIGLVLGLIASAVAAFSLFSDSTDKATERQEKFGESADKASDKVETLFAILKTSSTTSKVHKDALNELKSIADEYGVSLGKEENLTQNLIEKKEELIGLIREEAIERQRANDITDASGAYQQNIQEVKDKIKESLSDSFSEMQKNQLINLISEDDIKKLTSAYNDMIKAEKKSIELTGTWNSRFSTQQIEKYNHVISELTEKVGVYGKELGVNEKSINDAKRAVQDNGIALATTRKEYEDTVNATNKAAAAAQNAEMAADGLTESQRSLSDKTRMAKEDVNSLADEISKMVETYNNSNINIQISYEELNTPPAWMIGVGKKLSSDQLKNLASLHQSRANRMRNHKEQTGRNLVIKNGQGAYVNEREEQVMAGQYAILARNKKTEEDKTRRDAEEAAKKAGKNKKRHSDEKRRRDEEVKRIAEEIRGRNKAIKDYEKSILEQQKETELALRQQNIDLKEDSYEKEVEQINLNYDRLIAENDKRRKDMIEALKDNKVNEWLNKNPKATKVKQENYRNSLNLTESDLSATQNAQLGEYDAIAEKQKAKAQKDLYTKLLGEFQDYEVRRTQINADFDKKRKDLEAMPADTKGREQAIEELEKKRKESIKSVNNEEISKMRESSTLFIDLFGDAADKSDKEIRKIITETEELLSYLKNTKTLDITPNFGFTTEQLNALKASPEQIKAITEQLERLKQAAKSSNPFKQLAEDLKNLFSKNKEGKGESTEAKLKKLGASAAETAEMIGGIASKLSDMFDAAGNTGMADAMSTLSDAMTSVSNIGKGFAQGGIVGGITAAAGEAIGFVTKAFQASARHAEALKKIQQEIISQQRAYNLSLLEEKLNFEQSATVFGNLDYTKATNAVDVLREAYSKLNTELKGSYSQQRKYKNGVIFFGKKLFDYSDVQKAYSGLADIQIKTGHKKTGLFGWGKGKDLYSSILDVYPQLIDSAGNFNKKLAESIIGSREFNGQGKEALQNMIDLYDKTEEAAKQLKDYLSGIFGDLGNNMTDALVDAFKNGTDAGKAFGDSISKMLENIGKQMIFQTLFSGIIEDANNKMLDVMKNQSMSADSKFKNYVDILDTMTSQILGNQGTFNDLMSRYKGMAADKGINLFGSENEQQSASANGSSSITYEQSTSLIALITAGNISRDQIKDIFSTIMASAGTLTAFSSSTNSAVLEIKNLMIYSNSHLEDILKYTKSIYSEFSDKIDSINKNLMEIR